MAPAHCPRPSIRAPCEGAAEAGLPAAVRGRLAHVWLAWGLFPGCGVGGEADRAGWCCLAAPLWEVGLGSALPTAVVLVQATGAPCLFPIF